MTCWKVLLVVSQTIVGTPIPNEIVRSRLELAVDPFTNPPPLISGLIDARLVGFLLAGKWSHCFHWVAVPSSCEIDP